RRLARNSASEAACGKHTAIPTTAIPSTVDHSSVGCASSCPMRSPLLAPSQFVAGGRPTRGRLHRPSGPFPHCPGLRLDRGEVKELADPQHSAPPPLKPLMKVDQLQGRAALLEEVVPRPGPGVPEYLAPHRPQRGPYLVLVLRR